MFSPVFVLINDTWQITHPKVKTHPRQLWFFSQFLGSFFPLSICLFLAISPTLSPPPENQRHIRTWVKVNSECFIEKTQDFFFFFFWQNPSLLYFQSQYTTELEKSKAWRNKNQLKYLTLNRSSHSVITCWVFNSPNQQEIYNKLCGQTITQNNRKKNDKTKLKKFKTRMEIEV